MPTWSQEELVANLIAEEEEKKKIECAHFLVSKTLAQL